MSKKELRCDTDGCSALFGVVKNGVLTIKNRDLERSINGGRVWGPCRKCGKILEWSEDDSKGLR